jgi:hypothetical protein
VNDSQLSFSIGANETWEFEAFIIFNVDMSGSAGYTCSFAVPAGATVRWVSNIQADGTSTVTNCPAVTASNGLTTTSSVASGVIRMRGIVTNSSTAGTVQFEFEDTGNKTVTTKTNSFIKAGKF